jgi:hypothetical protein
VIGVVVCLHVIVCTTTCSARVSFWRNIDLGQQSPDVWRSTVRKQLLLASVLAILPSAGAGAATFTFADSQGAPYCDSIHLSQHSGIAGGVIDDSACKPTGNLIGAGVESRAAGHTGKIWSFGFNVGKYATLLILDEHALTWSMYTGEKTGGFQLQPVNSGTLLPGKVSASQAAPWSFGTLATQ